MRCIKIHINSFNASDLIPLTKQKTKNSNKKTVQNPRSNSKSNSERGRHNTCVQKI